MKKILVPTDGSNSSKAAYVKAFELAKLANAELVVFHVSFSPESYFGYHAFPPGVTLTDEQLTSFGQKVIDETIQGDTDGVTVTKLVEKGNPAERILKHVNTQGFDLIVMGTHGKGPFVGMLLGSVSQRVLVGAKCPVMVVKDPDVKMEPSVLYWT